MVRAHDESGNVTAANQHHGAVTAWFERVSHGRTVDSLLQTFEDTFAALWQRAVVTLGEVTLTAIIDRVLHTAMEQHAWLGSLEVDASGLRCEALRSQPGLRRDEVSAAIHLVLVEFLTVLGNLTAEILTPALHAELANAHAHGDQES